MSKKKYECRYCGKKYIYVGALETHERKCDAKKESVKAVEDPNRNPDGTFTEGNDAGEGNPHWSKLKRYREDYLRIFQNVVTKERIENIILSLIHTGLTSENVSALKVILEYAMGKPKQSVDISSPEDKARMAQKYLKKLQVNEVSDKLGGLSD